MTVSSAPAAWRIRRPLAAAVLLGLVAHLWVVGHRRAAGPGDYDVSREFGRRFVAGADLYTDGLHYPYMPAAAMTFAPLAVVPAHVGFALRYAAALGALWLVCRWLGERAARSDAAARQRGPLVAALTLGLTAPFVIRDMDDAGPHLLLLAIVVGGLVAVTRGRVALGAVCFGWAAAIKAPLGLLLPYLLWQRRWRLAALTAVATAGWIVLPALWMGPASWSAHQLEWTRSALAGPRLAEHRVQNQALEPAILRYLVTYPVGHPRRPPHPRYVSTGALSPSAARWLARGIIAALVVLVAARVRRPVGPDVTVFDVALVLGCATILSPIAWTQHFVFLLPAIYLIVSAWLGRGVVPRPVAAAGAAYVVLALVLNRELLGRDMMLLVTAYHHQTVAALIVIGLLLTLRRHAGAPVAG